MSYNVHIVVSDVDQAMTLLRDALRGAPVRLSGFIDAHEKLRKSVADLITTAELSLDSHPDN